MRWSLASVVALGCASVQDRGGPTTTGQRPPVATMSTAELGSEYQRLRHILGYFGGHSDSWNDDVDRWDGRKHRIMAELGKRLGVPGTSRDEVIDAMGEPDEVGRPGEPAWAYALRESRAPPEATEVLSFHWRGRHDVLFFVVAGDRVLRPSWWMAGE